MSIETWTNDNNQYLISSLQWLQLRLKQLLPEPSKPEPKSGPFWAKNPAARTESNSLAQQIQQAAEARQQKAAVNPQPALPTLGKIFGLSAFEQDIILLCAAMELDPAIPALLSQVPVNQGRPYPTFALAMTLFDNHDWQALAATSPLRYLQLVEINQPGATPLTTSALRLDERIVNYINGINWLDDRLLHYGAVLNTEPLLADSQLKVSQTILKQIQQTPTNAELPVFQILSTDGDSRLALAQTVCRSLNHQVFRLTATDLPNQTAEIETFARLWQRESLLLNLALYIDVGPLPGGDTEAALQRLLKKPVGLVFIGLRDNALRLPIASFSQELGKPSAAEQYQHWLKLLTQTLAQEKATDMARQLAGQFDLNLADIQSAVQQVSHALPTTTLAEQLWQACGNLTRPHLDALAQRLDCKATWDDLVVPAEASRLLRQIAGQVQARHQVYEEWGFNLKMNRGFGISALFAGDSGTGKTMAAEVIANALQLNLYRIDLSAVVSKYIGETEKNLCKLFDAAEQGGAILFFDEADALFGKRSEVKDSHDRYANIEINYLLQRMESFGGLAILASNMKSALDQAFMRRLRFIVDFQFPGVQERKAIWQKAFPKIDTADNLNGTPVAADLDYDKLARFNLSGGNIHSIALNAAFLASQSSEQAVSMAHILDAVRSELRKLNRPVNETEFRQMMVAASQTAQAINVKPPVTDSSDLAEKTDNLQPAPAGSDLANGNAPSLVNALRELP